MGPRHAPSRFMSIPGTTVFRGTLLATLGGLLLPLGAAPGGGSERFAFRYPADRPLRYAMAVNMTADMAMKGDAQSTDLKMTVALRYHVRLVPAGPARDGLQTLRLEPSDVEGDWDIDSGTGHTAIALRGAEMTGTHDGTVVIDTAHGIGAEQAGELQRQIQPLSLQGEVVLDRRGLAREFHGAPAFVEFWTEAMASQTGFWGIVFPEHAVAVGDTWQEQLTLKKMGQIRLEGGALQCAVTFARQPDVVGAGGQLATFALSAPFSRQGLNGVLEQMGQGVPVHLARFDRRARGTAHFDSARGRLTDSTLTADADATMRLDGPDQSVTMDVKLGLTTTANLLPDQTAAAR